MELKSDLLVGQGRVLLQDAEDLQVYVVELGHKKKQLGEEVSAPFRKKVNENRCYP